MWLILMIGLCMIDWFVYISNTKNKIRYHLIQRVTGNFTKSFTSLNQGFAFNIFQSLSKTIKLLLHCMAIFTVGIIGCLENDLNLIAMAIGGISNLINRMTNESRSIMDWIELGPIMINMSDIVVTGNLIIFILIRLSFFPILI